MVQSTNWPGKNKYHEAESAIAFKHFATTNYQNENLPLTFRTNNWFALSSANWNGEIDLNYTRGDRKFAVFSHPTDSARAVVRTILNNSSLTYGINDVKKDKWTSKSPLIKEQELTIYIDDDYKDYIKNNNFKIKELYWK